MSPPVSAAVLRRLGSELALLIAIGTVLGLLGPFDTDRIRLGLRIPYWVLGIVGGGVVGVGFDELLRRPLPRLWLRVLVVSLLASPLIALWVMGLSSVMLAAHWRWAQHLSLTPQVFAITLPVMAVRALARRAPQTVVETRTVVAAPLPEAEAAFRRRLSAKRRGARLIAVEAHDHYLRVHTDAGIELVTLRFSDALEELSGVAGFRLHRSWWAAAGSVEAVSWRRGAGEARLAGGVTAPVSRSCAPALKTAGW